VGVPQTLLAGCDPGWLCGHLAVATLVSTSQRGFR
jgi:hypothetical protein